jgi:alkylation response protein AidB-like acyl-CoA dehydrogenase
MNFALSDEQERLAATARAQLARTCPPARVREIMATPAGHDPTLHRSLAAAGWTGVFVPAAAGGAGLTMLDAAVLLGEMGRAVVPGPFLVSQIAAVTALRAIRSRHAGEWLSRLATGDAIATVALDDSIRAKRVRGGEHRLDGHARFVDYAHMADVVLVAAHGGHLFAVPRATRGVTATPLVTVDETRRPCELRLRGVRLPATASLGRVPAAIARARDAAAVAVAADSLGGAERALELAVEYVKVREQFGRAVGSFQAVQHMAAEAVARIEPARALLWYAAWAFDARPREAPLAAAMAKARCTDVFRDVARTAIEMHGGIGFTWEHDIHLYWKRALANWSAFGDAHAHRARVADLARL